MGSGSLTRNMENERVMNLKLSKQRKFFCFFKQSQKTSSSNISFDVAPKFRHQHTVQFVCTTTALATFEIGDKLCAEIRWALKYVLSGCNNNLCQYTVSIFKTSQ